MPQMFVEKMVNYCLLSRNGADRGRALPLGVSVPNTTFMNMGMRLAEGRAPQVKALGCHCFKGCLCGGGNVSLEFSKCCYNVGHKE